VLAASPEDSFAVPGTEIAPTPEIALSVTNLAKRYPGVTALADVSLALEAGEIRALCGKNGAGKSTLVKILSGAVQPDEGTVVVGGRLATLKSTHDARSEGIGTVFQELSLVPELSVAENILLGKWGVAGSRFGLLSPRAMARYAREALEPLEINLDVTKRVGNLSIAQQQVVEIAKALSYKPKVLILDEPTSSLPQSEVDVLLRLIRRLAEQRVAIIYVSHRMAEIPRVADSVTVLRDGRLIDTVPIAKGDTRNIVSMMTGGTWIPGEKAANRSVSRDVVLSVNQLSSRRLRNITFDLHRGEIIGLAGLLGSGRTALLRTLYGEETPDSGTILVDGKDVSGIGARRMSALGIGFTPEDRKREGLALELSTGDNLTIGSLARLKRGPLLSSRTAEFLAHTAVKRLSIKTPSLKTAAGRLSGGNQQKIILGKWLNAQARVLLMDEPTRGVDIEAKEQIYGLLRELTAEGISVVVASSEMEELFLFCDRILVMNNGAVIEDTTTAEADPDHVMNLAMKGTTNDAA
jgi:ABC-type sugar transport system ATPase subunit